MVCTGALRFWLKVSVDRGEKGPEMRGGSEVGQELCDTTVQAAYLSAGTAQNCHGEVGTERTSKGLKEVEDQSDIVVCLQHFSLLFFLVCTTCCPQSATNISTFVSARCTYDAQASPQTPSSLYALALRAFHQPLHRCPGSLAKPVPTRRRAGRRHPLRACRARPGPSPPRRDFSARNCAGAARRDTTQKPKVILTK